MQVISAAVASVAVLSAFVAGQAGTLTVNTPTNAIIACQPLLLTWTGGVPPYFPRIDAPGSQNNILEMLPQTSETSYSWTVNLAAGQTFTFAVADSTGGANYSAITAPISAGSTSCLNTTASTGASSMASSSGSSSAAGGASSSAAATTSRAASATSRASSAASSAAASATSAPANGGVTMVRGYAALAAGVVGVGIAAIL